MVKTLNRITETPTPILTGKALPEISESRQLFLAPDWTFRPSDMCNSEIFEAIARDKLLFIPEMKTWHFYNGKKWEADAQKVEVEKICVKVIQTLYALSGSAVTDTERRLYAAWALKSEDESRRRAMVSGAERMSSLVKSISEFDRDPWVFPCDNGVVDLKTGRLKPHSADDYILKISPVAYDPAAQCPLWEKTLNMFLQNQKSIIDYIQKLFGYTLTGVKNERLVVYFYGEGRNGKSTITGIPLKIFGEYGHAADISTFIESRWGRQAGGASEDVSRLAGIRYVKTSEIGEKDKLNEKFIKDLSGGDIITARSLYKNTFDFKPVLTLWMYGNEKIKIEGQDTGIKDRIKFIPLMYKIPKDAEDAGIPEKIFQAEASGVLNWIVKGCLKWQAEGLREPAEIVEATDTFFEEQDPVKIFIKECCSSDSKNMVKYATLYEAFTNYSDRSLSKHKFTSALKRMGYSIIPKEHNIKYVMGLCIDEKKTGNEEPEWEEFPVI